MINTTNKSECCGCGICSIVCPVNCISMIEDKAGFISSNVDEKKCIYCGKCDIVCPIKESNNQKEEIGLQAYAAFSKDKGVRYRGSSGGIFETVANAILCEGGSIFGCAFDEEFKLKCVEATDIENVRNLCKSKYLQSDCKEIFPVMKQRLIEGRKILFTSTPCQIAAFQKYIDGTGLEKNLILMDFFCHGVPSQKLFDQCRKYVEENKRIKITDYTFRAKRKYFTCTHLFTYRYMDRKGREREITDFYFKDPFFYGFQKYITLRDSCYGCIYGNGGHRGDLTIGDFHNVNKYIRRVNRFDGVSLVIINTKNGMKIWEKIEANLYTVPMDIRVLRNCNEIYSGGTKKPKNRELFLRDLKEKDFNYVARKWFNGREEWKKEIYYHLPIFMRRTIKKAIGL